MVVPGGVSRLTFTIDNTVNLISVGGLGFRDFFPIGMVVAPDPAAQTTCDEGTLAATAGQNGVGYSSGSVGAGQTCTIALDVQARRAGVLENISGNLTSHLPGASARAGATLTVDEAPLSVSMAFTQATILQSGVSRLSYELGNTAAIGATEVSLSDTLPAGVVVAAPPAASNDCGGTLTAAAGDDAIAFTGGELAANARCTIAVDVTSATAGSYPNDTETATSSLGDSASAEATLTVAAPLSFAKAFSPARVDQGEVSRLVFTIDNEANLTTVGGLGFVDTFPDGMVVADPPAASNTCDEGTLAATAGGTSVEYSGGGSIAAGQACTISVDVQALRAGALENISGDLASDLPGDAPVATATLTVGEAPLSVSMTFTPPAIAPGEVSRLRYELTNTAVIGAIEVSLSDTLPTDVAVAPVPDAQTTCAVGAVSATAGSDTITFTNGALAAGTACTIDVDVTSATAGSYRNATEAVTSSLGDSATAEATLTVDEAPLSVSMTFTPPAIAQGGVSRLSYSTGQLGRHRGDRGVAVRHAAPRCGGGSRPQSADDLRRGHAGGNGGQTTRSPSRTGSSPPAPTCTIAVDVTSATAGSYTNAIATETEPVTSSLGASATAEATLTVDEAPLSVSMTFTPSDDPSGRGLEAEL